MRTWLRHHRQALARALAKLLGQKSTALLNAIVIGVALTLPAGGYALLQSLGSVTQRIAVEPQVSLFLKAGASSAEVDLVAARLKADDRVAGSSFQPRDEALKRLRAAEGLAEVAAALGHNPLPDAFVVQARDSRAEALAALAGDLRRIPAVEHVQVDSDWARRLTAIGTVGRLATGVLAALLAVGLVAVTFNSIRLQILTQATEIEVSRLIGATDRYIARPFYYLGLLQGLLGGVVSLIVLTGGLALLNVGVAELATTYGSDVRLAYPGPHDAASILGFAGILGWLGAYLSVSIHLRNMP